MAGILERRQLLRVRTRRGHVEARRPFLSEGLVRAFVVEVLPKPIKTLLLSFEGRLRWPRRLRFEGAMHALVVLVSLSASAGIPGNPIIQIHRRCPATSCCH